MRSEKEVREEIAKIKKDLDRTKKGNVFDKCPNCNKWKLPIISVGELNYIDRLNSILYKLEWVLEGEPRYSVAELEKISEALWKEFLSKGICEPTSRAFIKRLKDTKKVQEALK